MLMLGVCYAVLERMFVANSLNECQMECGEEVREDDARKRKLSSTFPMGVAPAPGPVSFEQHSNIPR